MSTRLIKKTKLAHFSDCLESNPSLAYDIFRLPREFIPRPDFGIYAREKYQLLVYFKHLCGYSFKTRAYFFKFRNKIYMINLGESKYVNQFDIQLS